MFPLLYRVTPWRLSSVRNGRIEEITPIRGSSNADNGITLFSSASRRMCLRQSPTLANDAHRRGRRLHCWFCKRKIGESAKNAAEPAKAEEKEPGKNTRKGEWTDIVHQKKKTTAKANMAFSGSPSKQNLEKKKDWEPEVSPSSDNILETLAPTCLANIKGDWRPETALSRDSSLQSPVPASSLKKRILRKKDRKSKVSRDNSPKTPVEKSSSKDKDPETSTLNAVPSQKTNKQTKKHIKENSSETLEEPVVSSSPKKNKGKKVPGEFQHQDHLKEPRETETTNVDVLKKKRDSSDGSAKKKLCKETEFQPTPPQEKIADITMIKNISTLSTQCLDLLTQPLTSHLPSLSDFSTPKLHRFWSENRDTP